MVYSPAMTQSQAPPILWDVGMDLGNHQSPTNPQNLHSTLENDMRFWEGVIAAGVQVDGQLNINAVNDDEMQNLGGIISLAGANDHVIGEGVDHDVLPNVCVENAVVQAEAGGSSTGSNREGKQLGGGMLGAKPFEEDDFCPGEETAQGCVYCIFVRNNITLNLITLLIYTMQRLRLKGCKHRMELGTYQCWQQGLLKKQLPRWFLHCLA